MKAIDINCQCVTKWGSLLDPETCRQIEKYLGYKLGYGKTDEEMAQVLRDADVKAMVVLPTINMEDDIGKVSELNDRAAQFQKDYSDVIIGMWCSVNPKLGYKGLREAERCIKDLKFVGYYQMSLAAGVPINDKLIYPFLDLCCDAGVPVRWNVGHTAGGAGTPGGGGYHLGNERPIPFFDDVAAEFPKLTVISAHCSWPWHNEMISILLHKANAYAENHGWAPAHVPAEIKREIRGRLQDKFMFASDYPFFAYERLFTEWESEGFKPEILEKMYYKNAQKVFKLEI